MKFSIIYICILILLQIHQSIQKDICHGDGCRLAIKTKILAPLNNKYGETVTDSYRWKILLVYDDRFVLYDTDDQSAQFDRNAAPGQMIKKIGFSYVTLDCAHGQKLCLMDEFEKQTMINSNSTFFQPPKSFSDYSADGYLSDYSKRCIVVPIIGIQQEQTLQESSMFMCFDSKKYKDILKLRDNISRMIDVYQIDIVADQSFSGNGIPQKISNFHIQTPDGSFEPTKVLLTAQYIKAFKDPDSYSSLAQEISLRMVDNNKKILQVEKAIELGMIKAGEFNSFKSKNNIEPNTKDGETAESTCIWIPLRKPLIENMQPWTIMCLYVTKAFKESGDNSRLLAQRWVVSLNQKALRLQLLADHRFLKVTKLEEYSCYKADRSKQFNSAIYRIKNIANYQYDICDKYRVLDNFDKEYCRKILDDDVILETDTVSIGDVEIKEKLIQCVKGNGVDLSEAGTDAQDVL